MQEDDIGRPTQVVQRPFDRFPKSLRGERVHRALAGGVAGEVPDLRRERKLSEKISSDLGERSVGGVAPVVVRGVYPADPETQRVLDQIPAGIRPVQPEDNSSVTSAHTPSLISVLANTVASTPVSLLTSTNSTGWPESNLASAG